MQQKLWKLAINTNMHFLPSKPIFAFKIQQEKQCFLFPEFQEYSNSNLHISQNIFQESLDLANQSTDEDPWEFLELALRC